MGLSFQARCAIRHAWTGPVACANQQRGRWGGPLRGAASPSTEAAQKLAFVKRGGFDLVAMVARDDNETKIDRAELSGVRHHLAFSAKIWLTRFALEVCSSQLSVRDVTSRPKTNAIEKRTSRGPPCGAMQHPQAFCCRSTRRSAVQVTMTSRAFFGGSSGIFAVRDVAWAKRTRLRFHWEQPLRRQ